jgi:hypothetical protein
MVAFAFGARAHMAVHRLFFGADISLRADFRARTWSTAAICKIFHNMQVDLAVSLR